MNNLLDMFKILMAQEPVIRPMHIAFQENHTEEFNGDAIIVPKVHIQVPKGASNPARITIRKRDLSVIDQHKKYTMILVPEDAQEKNEQSNGEQQHG